MAATFKPVGGIPVNQPLWQGEQPKMLSRPWHAFLNKIRATLRQVDVFETSITPSAVSANSATEEAFTVTGVTTDMAVSVSPPGTTTGAIIGAAWASAADEVTIQFVNPTGSSVTPKAGTHKFLTVRP